MMDGSGFSLCDRHHSVHNRPAADFRLHGPSQTRAPQLPNAAELARRRQACCVLQTPLAGPPQVLDKEMVERAKLAPQIKKEIAIMRRLRHPNVVDLRHVMATRSHIYLVLELVTGAFY